MTYKTDDDKIAEMIYNISKGVNVRSIRKDIFEESEIEKIKFFEKKEIKEYKKKKIHAAAELVSKLGKIKTAEDIYKNFDLVVCVMREEIENAVIELKLCLNKDVQFAISVAARQTRMTLHKKYLDGPKRFFEYENDVASATKWLFQRILSNIKNSHNKKYKKSVFFECKEVDITDANCTIDIINKIEQELEFERIKKFTEKERIKAAKKVWQESLLDLDFDGEDLNQICRYLNISVFEVLGDKTATKIKAEETKLGHKQLFFIV